MNWRSKIAYSFELAFFVGIFVSSKWDEYFLVAAGLGALFMLWQLRRTWK